MKRANKAPCADCITVGWGKGCWEGTQGSDYGSSHPRTDREPSECVLEGGFQAQEKASAGAQTLFKTLPVCT